MKANEIPSNIGEYLAYDETSPTGLRWIKARQKINVGDPAGSLDNRNYYKTQFNGKCVISKTFPLSQFQAACDFADKQRAILHGEFSNNGENYNVF